MALYLGEKKVKIRTDGAECKIEFYSEILITNGVLVLSADDYILQDVEGVYITAKEDTDA